MIDTSRCMARRDDADLGGERCQEPATHATVMGRRCTRHAEALRRAFRDSRALCNAVLGRARTEEEIARVVVELPS